MTIILRIPPNIRLNKMKNTKIQTYTKHCVLYFPDVLQYTHKYSDKSETSISMVTDEHDIFVYGLTCNHCWVE